MKNYFTWDDLMNLNSERTTKNVEVEGVKRRKKEPLDVKNTRLFCPHERLIFHFREVLGPDEKKKFEWDYLRKVSSNEPDVVILQDIKDVVMYLLATPASIDFVNFFHTSSVDYFLRALILYFQYYIEIWTYFVEEREATIKKLPNPLTAGNKSKQAEEMTTLRFVLGKAYANLMFYSQSNPNMKMKYANSQTQLEKDVRLFEGLIRMSHRIVWIALERNYYTLIETEINRLFRTESFSARKKSKTADDKYVLTEEERRIIYGPKMPRQINSRANSPLIYQLLHMKCDFRILSLEFTSTYSQDPRVSYLQSALFAEEQELPKLGIKVGILGENRSEFNLFLAPIPKDKTTRNASDEMVLEIYDQKFMLEKRKSLFKETDLGYTRMPLFDPEPEFMETFDDTLVKSSKYDSARKQSEKKWIARKLKSTATNNARQSN